MSEISRIVAEIDAISSVDDEEQLARLEPARERFFASPEAAGHLDVWFGLFERFPEDDGYELVSTILHGVEALPGYEPLVVESVRRKPSRFPVTMLNRMLNGGQARVGDADLLALLEAVAADESCPASVREDAQEFVTYQRSRA